MERLPYNQLESTDYRYIRQVRLLRNKTLKQFGEAMEINDSTISKLENGLIAFTPHYQEKFKSACKRLRVSGEEIANIRKLLEIKTKRGIYK
ncbi:helix-turn-helix domain-containing protein [Terribacillus halophilus]|uniref:helix-turn-helix domain-containing protein n=1 Tax=Terribacillus halophilus TaxID=361279 RepID=UPI0009878A12|nr:helix-turn-helix transcriptional regulator [Terribacillus halophilus]